MPKLWIIVFFLGQFLTWQVIAADLDMDGMDDDWEIAHALNPGDPEDAHLDPDGDGLTSLEEFILQTHPFRRDTDGDWISDGQEVNTYGTNPLAQDTDFDGVGDFAELFYGFDPLDPSDVVSDEDNDGLTSYEEIAIYKTDPDKMDTDGDWIDDGLEIFYGFDPLSADTDGDGINDFEELLEDSDGDGLKYFEEINLGTNPLLGDTDGDLLGDGYEVAAGLDPTDSTDTSSDLDFDGFTAYEEWRLGSDPANASSVPPYLDAAYLESFEAAGNPDGWYVPPENEGDTWAPNCSFIAFDESCVLKSGEGARSTINFMARFVDGNLTLHWAAWTPYNDFTITVDGGEVFSFQGSEFSWPEFVIPLSGGVHEISITHAGTQAPQGMAALDAVSYAPSGPGIRPSNVACLAPPIEAVNSSVEIGYPFPELTMPPMTTKILQAPGDISRWFVLQKVGLLKVFDVDDPVNIRTYMDLTGDIHATSADDGLLGMAFDPDFPNTPEVYIFYTNAAEDSVLSRFVLDDTDAPVSPVEEQLLTLQKEKTGHYGGDISFGSDGMLYVSLGDSFRALWAQDTKNMFGTMIRIDVRGVAWPTPGYNIPDGNAFSSANPKCGPTETNSADCPEIYAWGFRNPWRWSFDSATGDIWLGDVGENTWEEINLVEAGGNYGWPCLEGNHPYILDGACIDGTDGMIGPVIEYSHAEGIAVIGGVVYRGSAIPEMQGRYVFADLRKTIWEALPDGLGGLAKNIVAEAQWEHASIVEGADGEIYIAPIWNPDWWPAGKPEPTMEKLVPGVPDDSPPTSAVASNLSETGCVNPTDPTQPAEGVIPYDINALFWSDTAVKTRFLALPDGTTIDINGEDDWEFPIGSVLMKNFRLDGKLIETRLLMNRLDLELGVGEWEGFTYEWNDQETEATMVVGGKVKTIDDQEWIYPSGFQCSSCHTTAAGGALGPETAQLNKESHYSWSSDAVNQLEVFDQWGMFTSPLGTPVEDLPALADPFDDGGLLEDRARAYLHTNCAQCHRPGTGNPASIDFRYATDFEFTNTCDVEPDRGDLGIGSGARLIAPEDPANSIVLLRMDRRDANGMPPIGSNLVDVEGVALITEWIESLQSCQ